MEVVVALLQKLQERCPLKHAVIRNSSSLLPNAMVEENEISTMKFQVLAERLFKLKWLTHYSPVLLICTPWKDHKTYRFSDVFRGYRWAPPGCNGLAAHETDDADLQYNEFVDSECSKYREKFVTVDKFTDVVGLFLGEFLHKNQTYISFWRVCGIIIVLSYGQSTIKRGFSVNKQLLVENLQEKSFVSQ